MDVTAARVLALAGALCALAAYLGPHRGHLADEAALARAAGVIAGRDVAVRCPGTLGALTEIGPHDGSVAFGPDGRPADETKLSHDTCSHLRRLLSGDVGGLACLDGGGCPRAVEKLAVAINVLTHEAWHLRGERNEAVAQCYALQTNAETALRLGAAPDEARAIARFVHRRVQPVLPPEYRTAQCYDGGPLDLHPEHSHWP